MDFLRRCRAEIDLDALDANMESIRAKCPDKKIIAVAKANCYGHSDIICGKEFYSLGIRHFSVSNLHEAERLREIIKDNNCFLLVFGYIEEERFPDILSLNLTATAGSVEFARRLNRFAASKNAQIKVNIAIDTGMSRVGVMNGEEIEEIMSMKGLKVTAFYTHFPAADILDEDNRDFTLNQHKKFLALTEKYGLPLHCQNSGGVAFYPEMKSDFIRPGLIPYGLSPNTKEKNTLELKQVMTLKSVIDQLKIIPKNTDIGYGRTYKTDKNQLIAIVPAGYADGYSRLLSNKGMVIVNDKLCPIRGRVCMDQIMIDVTEVGAKIGDEVILYSDRYKETSLDYISDLMGTISNEVICALSSRVPRVAVRKGEIVEVVNER